MPRKSCLLLALALLLAAGPAISAPGPAAALPVGGTDLLQQAWGWIVSVWSGARGCIDHNGSDTACAPLETQPKRGGCIDPNGGDFACAQGKLRAGIDPNGGNGSASPRTYFMKHGPGIDPDGGNGPASPSTYFIKHRCGIDPNGSTVCVP